ncbi:unnamed protein product [Citrullus colocynthis]|uniref:Uncharacterized protein n=1 Tax=Citrullus colocynthis TaxID=252529 RepID=A0ABP0Z3Z5_9ROSI
MGDSKKALITGVSKGLGRALALELASHNHTIIGCSPEGLSICVAKELPEGLAIVSLDPGTICTHMLALCLGHHMASQSQSPQQWALKAATIILGITISDNGASLTINRSVCVPTISNLVFIEA